ncbi:hypothetical protein PENCOP_c007G07340 [Penicillium coprophilum]|uniref:Major facilitator superfamily (MFS) profile domain-containing protein n=1 Tax=Penicillium coprophilum TaxID=36646 RepID=A0A1V6ULS3_9EURO|nr:hypothetical protein PENCOP_c007G07340 [Penicillium coprophilum]
MALGIIQVHEHYTPGTFLLFDESSAHLSSQMKYGTGKHANVVLVPQPSNSPNDPLNWPQWKKRLTYIVLFTNSIIFSSIPPPVIAPSMVLMSLALKRPIKDITMLTAYQLLTTACYGPIGSALAHKYGKRPQFIFASVMGFVGTLVCCTTTDKYSVLLAGRIIQGFGSAVFESLTVAVMGDIFYAHERSLRTGLLVMTWTCIISLVSILGGVIAEGLGWRYVFIIHLPFTVVGLLSVILFLPETQWKGTRNDHSLEAAAQAGDKEMTKIDHGHEENVPESSSTEPKETFIQGLAIFSGIHTDVNLLRLIFAPFFVIINPAVIWAIAIGGACIGFYVAVSYILAQIWTPPPYNLNAHQNGTFYVGGPFVRVGPNTVSTNSSSAITAIYSANAPVLKSPFYEAFAPGMPSSFTTNDKIYKQKKQILSAAFAPRKLEIMEPLIRLHIDTFCEKIAAAGSVDIAVMLGALSIDVLSDLCFGKCFDTLKNESERDRILEAMEHSVQLVIREGTMHNWPRAIWKVLHSKESMIKRGYVFQARRPDNGKPYEMQELMGEAILLLVAGSDTTSTALTVIIWHLLANPKTMQTLTAEIRDNFDSAEAIKYQALQGLPYLHAVIEEGLRICPPNPGLIPRVVVDRAPGHLDIDGCIFPPGTEIGVCNISLHHNPMYFDDPDAFLPERWLANSSIKCNKAAFSPFSYGPRSCLGRNMAYMEMTLTLALIVFRLKLNFVNHDNEMLAGFDVDDAFVAIKPSVPINVAKVGSSETF